MSAACFLKFNPINLLQLCLSKFVVESAYGCAYNVYLCRLSNVIKKCCIAHMSNVKKKITKDSADIEKIALSFSVTGQVVLL